jgi:hypothetical protein
MNSVLLPRRNGGGEGLRSPNRPAPCWVDGRQRRITKEDAREETEKP